MRLGTDNVPISSSPVLVDSATATDGGLAQVMDALDSPIWRGKRLGCTTNKNLNNTKEEL